MTIIIKEGKEVKGKQIIIQEKNMERVNKKIKKLKNNRTNNYLFKNNKKKLFNK